MSRRAGLGHDSATRGHWLLGAGLFASLALHVWSLMRFPAPFVDEAWLTSRAWAFIQTGRQLGPLDMGLVERFEGAWVVNQWLITFIQSLSLRLFGAPSLLAMRIVSLLFGLILLAAIYAIAYCLKGPRFGWLSMLLVSSSWPFLYSAHLARYDILTAAFGFGAIAIYLYNRSSFWLGMLSGACVGLAFETHAYGAIYAPVILILHFGEVRWRMFRSRRFWGLVVGGGLGLLYFAALHILPYPQTYFAVNQLAFSGTRTPPLLRLDPRVILQALADEGSMIAVNYHLLVAFVVGGVVILLRRRSKSDQSLLILAVSLVLMHALAVRSKLPNYAILVTPALALLAAAFLDDFLDRAWRGRWTDYASHVLVWGVMLGAVLICWSVVSTDAWQAYQATQRRVNQSIQPNDVIMSSQVYWLGLQEHKYYSWELLYIYQRYAPGSTLEDSFEEFRPDVFIWDGHINNSVADLSPQDEAYREHWLLPRNELQDFLKRRARLVDEFDGGFYGNIRVYRLNWKE